MAGRYYPGVDSERVSRKAKKLRELMAWAKTMEQKKTTGQEQAVSVVIRFVVASSVVADKLRASGYVIAGAMDSDAVRNETFIAYEETQHAGAGQVKPRKLHWNVRAWNEYGKHSLGWYGSAEAAITGAVKTEEQMATFQENSVPDFPLNQSKDTLQDMAKLIKESPMYPKGDLRRMLMVLGAIHEAGGATLVQIVARTGLDNKTVSDLIVKAQEQAGVGIGKSGSKYNILYMGPVLRLAGCKLALTGALNAL